MEFREKPMQNLIRIKEKEICKNVQELLLDLSLIHISEPTRPY